MTDSIVTQLQQASKGLLFLSETDAPFEVIHWSAQEKLALLIYGMNDSICKK
jgi:hypothetical protein